MPAITYYFSPLSPFSYLAGTRLEDLARDFNATITYCPFDIMAVFAETGGVPPAQRHISRQNHRRAELRRLAILNDLPITLAPKHWPTDPTPAALAIIAATQTITSGDPGRLVHDLMAQCWAEEQNIADAAVIRDCLARAGYDPATILPTSTDTAVIYATNTTTAIANGVFGAPTYILDDQVFWGQDRLSHLQAQLEGRFDD